jgi:hypothetical protein
MNEAAGRNLAASTPPYGVPARGSVFFLRRTSIGEGEDRVEERYVNTEDSYIYIYTHIS